MASAAPENAKENTKTTTEAIDRVWSLIDKIPTSMLVTMDGAEHRARPMSHRGRRSENAIYFLIDADGAKNGEIEHNPHICLTFADPGGNDFVSVSGVARVLDDRPIAHDLWTKEAGAFFDGPEDPKLRVLEVTPSEAQYWSGPNMLVASAVMLASGVTSKQLDLGEENAKVKMN